MNTDTVAPYKVFVRNNVGALGGHINEALEEGYLLFGEIADVSRQLFSNQYKPWFMAACIHPSAKWYKVGFPLRGSDWEHHVLFDELNEPAADKRFSEQVCKLMEFPADTAWQPILPPRMTLSGTGIEIRQQLVRRRSHVKTPAS